MEKMKFDQHLALAEPQRARTRPQRVARFLQLQRLVARDQVHRREVALPERAHERVEIIDHGSTGRRG